MNWEEYAKELEIIIEAIDMPEYRRTLVNGAIEIAREKCKIKNAE